MLARAGAASCCALLAAAVISRHLGPCTAFHGKEEGKKSLGTSGDPSSWHVEDNGNLLQGLYRREDEIENIPVAWILHPDHRSGEIFLHGEHVVL